MENNDLRPKLDVDRDRIREVVSEAYRITREYVDGEFVCTKEQVMESLEKYLSCGLAAATFRIPLGNRHYPDMVLRVDPRRKEVALVSLYRKATGRVNRILRALR